AARGYPCTLVMPEPAFASQAVLRALELEMRALGAEVVLTPAAEGMVGAVWRAEKMAASDPRYFMPQQFRNPANPAIHRTTTAEEIWRQTEGQIDFFVAGVG